MNRNRLGTLWELTRGHRARYLAAILAMGISHVFLFGWPFVSRTAIDGIVEGGFTASSRLGGLLLALAGTDDPPIVLGVAGILTVALGYFLLSQGSITAAPFLLVLGYVILLPLAIIL